MAIDLLALQPHKVSRDLSGYITYIYGAPKCGKTTLASQMEKPLLLAFEPGYHALPGVIAQDITSWAEMKQVYRQLKMPEVQQTFRSFGSVPHTCPFPQCGPFPASQCNRNPQSWTAGGQP